MSTPSRQPVVIVGAVLSVALLAAVIAVGATASSTPRAAFGWLGSSEGTGAPLRGTLIALAPLPSSQTVGTEDTHCNGGRGLRLAAGVMAGYVNDTTTTRGIMLVTITSINSQFVYGPAVTYAVTPTCSLDRSFGVDGVLRLSAELWPAAGGDFFATVDDGLSWRIGEYLPNGTSDSSFGRDGWETIEPPGGQRGYEASISDVEVEPSGRILVFGNDARSHAGNLAYLYALRPDGSVDPSFGFHGRVRLFDKMTYASSLVLQPDGLVAATGSLGGGGCFNMPIEWLRQDGAIERSVGANFAASDSPALQDGYNGAAFLDPAGGVGVVGQLEPCGRTTGAKPGSSIQELMPNGRPDRGFGPEGIVTTRTANPADFDISAALLPDRDLVLQSFADEQDPYVYVQDFNAAGKPVHDFGRDGLLQLKDESLVTTYSGPPGVLAGPRQDFTVAIPESKGVVLQKYVS